MSRPHRYRGAGQANVATDGVWISQCCRDDKIKRGIAAMRHPHVVTVRLNAGSWMIRGGALLGRRVVRRIFEIFVVPVLHVYWRLTRGLTLGVRAIVIDDRRRVFLVRHTYVTGWYLPGGGVEPGETLLAALARELREEGHIELTGAPRLWGMYFNDRVSRRDHVAVFLVEEFQQGAAPAPNREIAACGFFPLDDLPGGTTAGTRARLAELMLGTPPRETW
jgi:8-oxo-dGTP pyrophosphatase MutT (NUDIX family)